MINQQDIQLCLRGNRQAQQKVYNHLGPMLYQVSKRYLKDDYDIENILSEAFYIIFTKMEQLQSADSIEAWARKITVNQCLQQLRKNVNFHIAIHDMKEDIQSGETADTGMNHQELLKLLESLPYGCKTVFNLYIIEGYNHKEIAQMLGIAEGTSKSQLNVAKHKLQQMILANNHKKEEHHGKA